MVESSIACFFSVGKDVVVSFYINKVMNSVNLLGGSSDDSLSVYLCLVTGNGSSASWMTKPSITWFNTLGLIIAFGSSDFELVVLETVVLPLPGDGASSTEPAAVASLSFLLSLVDFAGKKRGFVS